MQLKTSLNGLHLRDVSARNEGGHVNSDDVSIRCALSDVFQMNAIEDVSARMQLETWMQGTHVPSCSCKNRFEM
jgi:energy-converting hydrogenase A subunit M